MKKHLAKSILIPLFTFIVLWCSCSMPAKSWAEQPLDRIVAIVNDDVITKLDLLSHTKLLLSRIDPKQANLPPQHILERQILNQMILDTVQLQLASSMGIEVDSATVDETLKDIAENEQLTLDQLRHKLAKAGIPFSDMREHVRHEIIIARLRQREVGQEIVVSSADIDSFLNSPVGQDHTGTEYHLSHILLSAPSSPTPEALDQLQLKANSIVNELKAGANFAEMAMAKSTGQHALEGGDLGWKRISELPTLFVKHVPSMQLDEVVGPIRSANGLHIIKLTGKRNGNKETHVETHVRHILIKPGVNLSDTEAKNSLEQIRKQIINGANFAKLAEQKSEELSTAIKGGDLGWISTAAVTPEFYAQMQKLTPGNVNAALSQPFKTELGWHLIEVLGRRSQDDSIEAARNKATEILRQQKFQDMLEAWLKRIRGEARIEILTA